jgi:hypothetical protein
VWAFRLGDRIKLGPRRSCWEWGTCVNESRKRSLLSYRWGHFDLNFGLSRPKSIQDQDAMHVNSSRGVIAIVRSPKEKDKIEIRA